MPPKSSNDNPFAIGDNTLPSDDDGEFGLRDALSKPARRLRRQMQTKTVQLFIMKRFNSYDKNKIQLYLVRRKITPIQNAKVDLPQINIITLASQVGVLSEDVKLYMKLLPSKIHCASTDRTVNWLVKGDIDMSATTFEQAEGVKESDSDVIDSLGVEKEVDFLQLRKYDKSWRCILPIFKQTQYSFCINMEF